MTNGTTGWWGNAWFREAETEKNCGRVCHSRHVAEVGQHVSCTVSLIWISLVPKCNNKFSLCCLLLFICCFWLLLFPVLMMIFVMFTAVQWFLLFVVPFSCVVICSFHHVIIICIVAVHWLLLAAFCSVFLYFCSCFIAFLFVVTVHWVVIIYCFHLSCFVVMLLFFLLGTFWHLRLLILGCCGCVAVVSCLVAVFRNVVFYCIYVLTLSCAVTFCCFFNKLAFHCFAFCNLSLHSFV